MLWMSKYFISCAIFGENVLSRKNYIINLQYKMMCLFVHMMWNINVCHERYVITFNCFIPRKRKQK